jgi:splicing factor U2AF subunit
MSPREMQEHFEAFYEDFYCEAALFGKLEEVVVAENGNDHLMGNVYARFKYEEDAQKAKDSFNSRWYAGRPIYCELSPVTDFGEACCRQHEQNDCNRRDICNFIHAKRPPQQLLRDLDLSQKKYLMVNGKDSESEEESEPARSPKRSRHD